MLVVFLVEMFESPRTARTLSLPLTVDFPLVVSFSDLRKLDAVEDDEDAGELKEGKCVMCERQTKLTWHHLIPKQTHSTYLKKRLPRGIEGEPTREFLNSYGLWICQNILAPTDPSQLGMNWFCCTEGL